MRYVSVFSGIEAASVAWSPLGWEPVCFSEIEPFPSAVLAERFPEVPNLGDITKVNWSAYEGAADLVVGGSPCQAFSIAGLREGLKDPRGNLMLEWLRVVDEVKPEFALWENVPGVLSDKTGAFRTLLDSLQSLGYIIDMDILDAQHFGVAQRRKRVFVLGWRAETLLKRKTSTSRTITAQILGKILLDTLEGLLAESEKGHASSACAEISRDGLLKRMKSLGLRTQEDLSTWLKSLEDQKERLALELKNLATHLGMKSRDMLDTEATSVFEMMENERSFTELLWRTISDETSEEMSAYTTSTSTSLTTRSRIFICSIAGLIIARLMSHWKQLDRVYCNEGLYISTLLKEFTSYAIRKNERVDLFNGFDDVLSHIGREAERQEKIIRDFGNECGREIQLEPDCLRWDHPSSREKREELAGAAGAGAGSDCQPIAFKYSAGAAAKSMPTYDDGTTPTLTADWHSPAVAYAVRMRAGKPGGGKGPLVQTDVSGTLATGNDQTIFQPICMSDGNAPMVLYEGVYWAVRRLMPVECERLQGFPDGWTDIPWRGKDSAPDGPRYKALGNSMAVPVMRWIGERIADAAVACVDARWSQASHDYEDLPIRMTMEP